MPPGGPPDTADVVVVGGGTVGSWCAYFLRCDGLRVTLLEQGTLGQGASSRAAGVVRAQGGTPEAVRLAQWSRAFYLRQHEETRDRLRVHGPGLPAALLHRVRGARGPGAPDHAAGAGPERGLALPGRGGRAQSHAGPGQTLGGTFCPDDGYLTPPRNVTAYAVALAISGVDVRERTAFTGLAREGGRVTGVATSTGVISAGSVVLTGGPQLAAVGRQAGLRIPVGGARHQVAVTEPHPDLHPSRVPMVFDLAAGLYWRPEEGGLLFGMSNPAEPPGEARAVDEPYLARMRARLQHLVPVTAGLGLRRLWAATIDYTPDHLPIIGPALDPDGPVPGVTVAAAGGAGMMWGPGVARAAADLVLTGRSAVVDTAGLGLDRFDSQGRSKLAADPIALPFPETTGLVAH